MWSIFHILDMKNTGKEVNEFIAGHDSLSIPVLIVNGFYLTCTVSRVIIIVIALHSLFNAIFISFRSGIKNNLTMFLHLF